MVRLRAFAFPLGCEWHVKVGDVLGVMVQLSMSGLVQTL